MYIYMYIYIYIYVYIYVYIYMYIYMESRYTIINYTYIYILGIPTTMGKCNANLGQNPGHIMSNQLGVATGVSTIRGWM